MQRVLAAIALVVLGALVVRPLWMCEYPPLTDLPEHALATAVIAHHGAPGLRFEDSYEISLFERPTAAFYLTGAAVAQVTSLRTAVKAAVAITLLSVPLGLMALLAASRRDPALAVLAVSPLFGTLLHWGFVNYLLAAGVYLATLAAIVHDLEAPSARRATLVVLLGLVLFFTHVWGVLVLAVTGVPLVLIAGRGLVGRLRSLALLAPVGLLSLSWWLWARPPVTEAGPAPRLEIATSRIGSFFADLSGGLSGRGLPEAMRWAGWAVVAIAAVCVIDLVIRALVPRMRAPRGRGLGRLDIALLLIPLVHFALYLVLPMDVAGWWFVYPREAFFVAITVPAALPAIRWRPLQWVAVVVAVVAAPWPALEAGTRWPELDRWTAGFDEVVRRIPKGSDLMALVSASRAPGPYAPLLHFGAWANALRGGRPAWSFAVFGASPVHHPEGKVPPPLPRRWEWTATSTFRFERHGQGWDHFLVGHTPPTRLFYRHLGRDVEVVISRRGWSYVRRITARRGSSAPRARPE